MCMTHDLLTLETFLSGGYLVSRQDMKALICCMLALSSRHSLGPGSAQPAGLPEASRPSARTGSL